MERDDIFKDVEVTADIPAPPKMPDALSSGMLKRKESPAPMQAPTPSAAPSVSSAPSSQFSAVTAGSASALSKPILGKILLAVVAVVVIGGVGFGGWWIYGQFMSNKVPASQPVVPETPEVTPPSTDETATPTVEPTPETVPATEATSTNVTTKTTNDSILFGEQIDSDKDGLDDVREKQNGTNPNNPDTGGDGLSDGDEVLIWKTNPLNPDTDGDTHSDGKEVRNGYSPLGPGKLFATPNSEATSTK